MKLADKYNSNAIILSNLFYILPNLLCKGLREIRIIKNTDSIKFHISGTFKKGFLLQRGKPQMGEQLSVYAVV